jgi:hypothetical protein
MPARLRVAIVRAARDRYQHQGDSVLGCKSPGAVNLPLLPAVWVPQLTNRSKRTSAGAAGKRKLLFLHKLPA